MKSVEEIETKDQRPVEVGRGKKGKRRQVALPESSVGGVIGETIGTQT